ncbi:MAG: hypothetical protein Q9217_001380 [Psora testacea]
MSLSQPSDDQALGFLATHGWLPIVLADHPDFVEAYTALQTKAADFFALPEISTQKMGYEAASGTEASEEGYSKIPDEKSILTIKTSGHCPQLLNEQAKIAWDLTGNFLAQILGAIAATLDLKQDVFAPFVDPCKSFPFKTRTPTLLRMFRYDRPPGPDLRVNAEAHRDLGLLSLVVGHSPGLHVKNSDTDLWVPVEEDAVLPPDARTRSRGLTATLLGGETLAFLTRGQYKAGVHGVVCEAPTARYGYDPYRYSIVFTLRPAPAAIFTREFESEITGAFEGEESAEGESMKELFAKIRKTHYNINAAPEVRERQREEQRKRMEELQGQE